MSQLTSYTPLTFSSASLPKNEASEVLLKTYNISSGVSTITISDASFKLTTYKAIHVRLNNITSTGTTNARLFGGLLKNNDVVVTQYYSNGEAISSSTATGWFTSSVAVTTTANLGSVDLSPALTFTTGTGQIDIYLNDLAMQVNYHHTDATNSRRIGATVTFSAGKIPFTSSDYVGMLLGFSTGTFTGGTVSVYGVQ